MKAHIFQDALASTTKVFGRKDVNVVFSGDGAKTNNSTVYLPSIAPGADVVEADAAVMRGYRSHEAMHLRGTDMSPEMDSKIESLVSGGRESLFNVINMIEDIRIESAGTQEYPGMRADLEAVTISAANLTKKKLEEVAAARGVSVPDAVKLLKPASQLAIGICAHGRSALGMDVGFYAEAEKHLKPEIAALAKKAAAAALALPTGISKRTGNINENACKAGTTDAVALSVKVYDELRELPEPPPPPPPPDGGKGKGDGDGAGGDGKSGDEPGGDQGGGDSDSDSGGGGEGGGDGDGKGGGKGDDGDGKDGDGKDGDGDGKGGGTSPPKPGDGDGDGDGSGGATNQTGEIDFDLPDQSEAVRDVADRLNGSAGGASPGGVRTWLPWSNSVVTENYKDFRARRMANRSGAASLESFDKLRSSISGKQAMIRRVLEQELQARQDRLWRSGYTSGRLNNGRLADAVNGVRNVYRQRQDGADMDTLLRIHVDSSGSMSDGLSRVAAQLTLALCDALERTGCEVEVSVWSSGNVPRVGDYRRDLRERINAAGAGQFRPKYTSYGQGTIINLKGARSRLNSSDVKEALGNMQYNLLGGGTPLIDTLLPVVAHMTRQRHGKRILLVVTDGDPDGVLEGGDGRQIIAREMARIHDECAASNVHLIGVGINVKLGHLFSDFVSTSGPDTFEAVVRRIAKYLKQERTNAFKQIAT